MSRTKSQADKGFKILLPLLLLLLSGCISQNRYIWQHPNGYGEVERQQAIATCEGIANEEVRKYDYFYPFPYYYDRHYYRDRDRAFFFPHYYHYNSHREFQDRRRYFRICMKSKGWRLRKLPAPQAQQ